MYPNRRVSLDTCAWEDTKLSENRLLQANDLFLNSILDELRLIVDIEFAHQVEFVGLDGLYAEFEGAGDIFDGFAFGQHFENLALPFGERAETGLAGRSTALHAEIVHQAGEQARAQATAAVRDFANGGQELFHRTVFQDVAAGPDVDALGQIVLVVVHGEEDHLGFGSFLANLARGLEAAHAGHADVHENDIGPRLPRHRDRIQRVGGFAHHFHVGFGGEQGPDTVPEEWMIVG